VSENINTHSTSPHTKAYYLYMYTEGVFFYSIWREPQRRQSLSQTRVARTKP